MLNTLNIYLYFKDILRIVLCTVLGNENKNKRNEISPLTQEVHIP